ncbi:hypothetical protein M426DRAFT_234554 [Hypoxylon sp. CI-4A]|nr:hypothetical protein M426DRAFT_234554 [Hypoxylon sp. CI-4A]
MDEFAQLSRENFEVFQRYGDASLGPDPEFRTISVCASHNAPTSYVDKELKLGHLNRFFRGQPSGGGGVAAARAASLNMVVIDSRLESWSQPNPSLWVTKDVFLNLVDTMNMNPAALWLLRSEYDGFHHFPSSYASPAYSEEKGMPEEDRAGMEEQEMDTFYIGTSSFVLIWTFDRQRSQTRALWILRQQRQYEDLGSKAPVAWFLHILRRHQDHVYSPFLLAYVAALSVCCTFDGEISYRAHVVRLTERETGYSTHSSSIQERLNIELLTVYIKEVGEVLNHVANQERHFRMLDSILDFLIENAIVDPGGFGEKEESSTRRLVAAIPLLRRRMHASQEYLQYLKERAERLSTVVSS